MNQLRALITVVLLLSPLQAIAQQNPSPPKTIPDSINYMWKMVESDFTSLAEAMPEEKWSFKPTQGAFSDVRTFGEQVKHVACANEAWAKKLRGEKPPDHCDTGGPNPAKTKTEILAYLHETTPTNMEAEIEHLLLGASLISRPRQQEEPTPQLLTR